MFALVALLYVLMIRLANSQGTPTDLNRVPPQPQATTCGDIVQANQNEEYIVFNASQVFDCLTSVPFNAAVALRFLAYVNQTFQFQAGTTFIRDPPAGYQQPPVDFFGKLRDIDNQVAAGLYNNQYAFEWDVQTLLQQLHDGHVSISGGVSNYMSFLLPGVYLVSISSDGKEPPQIFNKDDLLQQWQASDGYTANPVVEVNGRPIVDYLTSFAAQQSVGYVEPHADWNNMMWSPAQDIFGTSALSDYAPFYPGDQFVIRYENGSVQSYDWYALYSSPGYTGPLETGGDFYNFFVLGLPPANFAEQSQLYYQNHGGNNQAIVVSGSSPDPDKISSWHDEDFAYPSNTMMHQVDLGKYTSGAITGYYLSNISTAVLSIPTFELYGDAIADFSQAVSDFINNATDRGAKKIIIDLQQNAGGDEALVFGVMDAFFPENRPFAGSRMRSHFLANVLGSSYTSYYDSLRRSGGDESELDILDGSEWVVTDRINAETGQNFTSWAEFYGPIPLDGDDYSRIERYDYSNPTFVAEAASVSTDDLCYFTNTCHAKPPWNPEDMVILTDGLCAASCSLFVEMMLQAGVQSVVVGGTPHQGPMQAASGTRGAVEYSGSDLDLDYSNAGSYNQTAAALLPTTPSDTGMALTYISVSLLDQYRANQTVPNQVLYLPANCRLYWTIANLFDYDRLWTDVYTAAFVDRSRCVPGSSNVTAAPARPSTPPPPFLAANNSTQREDNMNLASSVTFDSIDAASLQLEDFTSLTSAIVSFCGKHASDSVPLVRLGWPCKEVNLPCHKPLCSGRACSKNEPFDLYSQRCTNANNQDCAGSLKCQAVGPLSSGKDQSLAFVGNAGSAGFCVPPWSIADSNRNCDKVTRDTLNSILLNDEKDFDPEEKK